MSGVVTAAFPSGPLLDPVTGEVSPAWRGFFVALYNRTGQAQGVSTGATQAALDAEAAARIAGDHNLQAQIDSISGSVAAGAANAVIMRSGRGASDDMALVRVTLPTPFTVRTLSFAVDGNPVQPGAFLMQGLSDVTTTSLVTGTLQTLSGGDTVNLTGTPFTWYATGV